MKNRANKSLIAVGAFIFFFAFFSGEALAATLPYLLTSGIDAYLIPTRGDTFYTRDIIVNHQSGKIIFSHNADGTGNTLADDAVEITVIKPNGSVGKFTHTYQTGCSSLNALPPKDITNLFGVGENKVHLRLYDMCGWYVIASPMYLVNINAPDPTPTPTSVPPTPTPPPAPEPFLDLPWDYEAKGMSFNDAALSINSFFDHQYPLLSSGLAETGDHFNDIVIYRGFHTRDPYSAHDGYDYGTPANVHLGDPLLAAASGWATYVNACAPCGNMILIDHQNGYQTRYLHMQKDGLATTIPGQKTWVNDRQAIGRVGATGNVFPHGDAGAHIHFGVFEDKNKDGNFSDNIPDGVTDPFGWQSEDPDPWEHYSFFYNGQQRTGNKSYYLWKKKLEGLKATIPANGGVFKANKTSVEVQPETFPVAATIEMKLSPIVKASPGLWSIGPAIDVTVKNVLGDAITILTKPIKIWWAPFDDVDLARFKLGTVSIYSSKDGQYWTKEQTIDSYTPGAITAAVSHLTYFAVMGERKDVIPPVTTAQLDGEQGQANWFRSDVSLSLSSTDTADEDPAGVAYILYKIDKEGEDWQTYTEPLQFVTEGHHKVFFYSGDNDGNFEEVKTVEFDIDKTLPQVNIDANPKKLWPPNGKMTDITIIGSSSDEHSASISFSVEDEYDEIEPAITSFGQTIKLQAKRNGNDQDGRSYVISAIAADKAGNQSIASTTVLVPHDQR